MARMASRAPANAAERFLVQTTTDASRFELPMIGDYTTAMSPTTRPVPHRVLLIALGCCLVSVPLAAQEAPIGQFDLAPAPLSVNLTAATVRILSGDPDDAGIRWWLERLGETGLDELSVTEDAGAIVIERPVPAEGEVLARLLIEISMPSGHPILVAGGNLDLDIDIATDHGTAPESVVIEPPTKPDASVSTTLGLQLVDSTATLTGVESVTATLDGCTVNMNRTTGQHQLTVIDGELRIVEHEGNITVTTRGGDIAAEKTKGQVSIQATGGSVDLRATKGRFNIHVINAHLQLIDANGTGAVTVNDSNADLRDMNLQTLSIKSIMSHTAFSSSTGKTTLDLTGGSLTAGGITGDLSGAVRDGATIFVADHKGNVNLTLQQDTSADLSRIWGDLTLSARDARLTVDEVNTLALTADDCWASFSAIGKLSSFKVTRSEVELDLSESRERNPKIAVQAASHVRVRLSTPCRVSAAGLASSLASQLDVTGCELQLGKGNRWATRRVRGIDGQPPVTLNAQIADSAELIVEGRP